MDISGNTQKVRKSMKSVFEKIIEALEENQTIVFNLGGGKPKQSIDLDKAIEIINQTAEEYNNGWIPCSERLPEEGGYYLVTYHGWSNGDYLPKFDDTYVRRLHYQKSERFTGWNHPRYCDDKAENDTNREVIAWQPLPQPYQPKGE